MQRRKSRSHWPRFCLLQALSSRTHRQPVSLSACMSARRAMSVVRKIVRTEKAGLPVGPYNQAVVVDKTVYVSGQIPLVPATGQLATGGIVKEAEQVLENLKAVVEAAGSSMGNVVKTTILLKDINDWPAVNEIYAKYFPEKYPARAAYQVAALPKGANVEMEAVAVIGTIEDVE